MWLHLSFSRRPLRRVCRFSCFDSCLFWHGGARKREFFSGARERERERERGLWREPDSEESEGCLWGVRGVFKKAKEEARGEDGRKRRRRMWKKVTLVEGGGGLGHFCVRYAPMVRLAAPSAAMPKTVLMEGQEQLKTESLCLSYSSTKASWERDRRRKTDSYLGCQRACVYLCVCSCISWLSDGSNENTTQDQTGISFIPTGEQIFKGDTACSFACSSFYFLGYG